MTIDDQDELDRWLDRVFTGRDPDHESAGDPDDAALLRALFAADAETPGPSPEFARSLRADLVRRHRGAPAAVTPAPDATALGLVAAPLSLPRERDMRLLLLAVAAAILIAIAGSSIRWNAHGHPSVNVATAQASVMPTAVVPTVTATLTVPLVAT
jgi:hypothetical protein